MWIWRQMDRISCTQHISAAAFLKAELNASKGNPRQLWKTLENFHGLSSNQHSLYLSADDFHAHIEVKVNKVCAETMIVSPPTFLLHTNVQKFTTFRKFTTADVTHSICQEALLSRSTPKLAVTKVHCIIYSFSGRSTECLS